MVGSIERNKRLRDSIKWGGSGIEFEVVNWICNHTSCADVIVELGAGDVSTPFLGSIYENFYSIESENQWVNKYNGVKYILCPTDTKTGWYNRDILLSKIPKQVDLYLIDGPFGNREGIIENKDLFDKSAYFIFHDTDREKDRETAQKFYEVMGFTKVELNDNFICMWE